MSVIFALGGMGFPAKMNANDSQRDLRVLCSTYPIFQITRQVVVECEGIAIELLLSEQMGCPHDYILTPDDMLRLARADVLVINGLGMEEFIGAPVKRSNKELFIVDSSKNIKELLYYQYDHSCLCLHHSGSSEKPEKRSHQHSHTHSRINPHLFANPQLAGRLAMGIAEQLSCGKEECRKRLTDNALRFQEKMNALHQSFIDLVKNKKRNAVISQHGIFDYLLKDLGFESVAYLQGHPGEDPSASEVLELVNTAKECDLLAIIVEPQYSNKLGKLLSREANVPLIMLDPVASGPSVVPLDYYEKVMIHNLKILERILHQESSFDENEVDHD